MSIFFFPTFMKCSDSSWWQNQLLPKKIKQQQPELKVILCIIAWSHFGNFQLTSCWLASHLSTVQGSFCSRYFLLCDSCRLLIVELWELFYDLIVFCGFVCFAHFYFHFFSPFKQRIKCMWSVNCCLWFF